jgi:hypothetical protein
VWPEFLSFSFLCSSTIGGSFVSESKTMIVSESSSSTILDSSCRTIGLGCTMVWSVFVVDIASRLVSRLSYLPFSSLPISAWMQCRLVAVYQRVSAVGRRGRTFHPCSQHVSECTRVANMRLCSNHSLHQSPHDI